MAGRDRIVTWTKLPTGLRYLVECYQSDRQLPTLSEAIRELIETHPAIAERLERVYAEGKPG